MHVGRYEGTGRIAAIVAAVAAVGAATPAFAEEAGADGNEIIVNGVQEGYVALTSSALKTDTPLLDTPQAVSVLTAEQIADQALTDIADILRYTPGASAGQGEGHRDQFTIRGQNTTADFFVDGIRDDVQYFRPLYNLERVEIHKGANALVFGRGGGGGIINRVTKSPIADDALVAGRASVDTFGSVAVAADVNTPIAPGAAVRINAFYEALDNHRDFYDGDRFAINPAVGAELYDATRLSLSYEYVDDDRVVDRGVPSEARAGACTAADPCGPLKGFDETFFGAPGVNRTTFAGHIVKLRAEHDISDDVTFGSTTLYADFDKFYRNVFPAGSGVSGVGMLAGGPTVTLDGYLDTTLRENFITQGNLVWNGATGGIGHTLLVGYELGQQESRNARRDTRFGATGTDRLTVPLSRAPARPALGFPVFNRDRASELGFVSLYVQDQIALGDHVDIIAGVRFDRFDIEVADVANARNLGRVDEEFSPRLGVVVKPRENMSIYASYSNSFLPRSGDQFLTLDPTTANLAPEKFTNTEIGAKWNIRPDLVFTAALFRLDRDDQAVLLNADGDRALSGSRTEGLEAQLTGYLTPEWQINAGYSYLDAEQRDAAFIGGDGLRLAQVPEHMFAVWTRYQVTDALGLGAGVTHQSSQFARNDNRVRVPGFTRFDAAAFYRVNDRVRVQINIENLFDTDYFPSVHNNDNITVGEPLNARLGVAFDF